MYESEANYISGSRDALPAEVIARFAESAENRGKEDADSMGRALY